MATAVFGIASTYVQAETVVEALKAEGFANTDVSILFPNTQDARNLADEEINIGPQGTVVAGAGSGAVLGGALGWLTGIGSLAIPGLGPFVAAGPLMAALGGAAVGSAVGGLVGALVRLGIPEYEAERYAGKLRDGNILISVHSENSAEADLAEKVLKRSNAHDISAISQVSAERSTDTLPHPGLA